MELPEINKRIRVLINMHADGKINRFAKMCNMSSSFKLNRLFLPDKRNNKIPIASIDIILDIINNIDVDVNWLITGEEKPNMLVNEERELYKKEGEFSVLKAFFGKEFDELKDQLNLIEKQNNRILENLDRDFILKMIKRERDRIGKEKKA